MDANVKLNDAVCQMIDEMLSYPANSNERKEIANTLATLYNVKVIEDNNLNSIENSDKNAKKDRIIRCIETGLNIGVKVVEIALPLTFYGIWMANGFEYEKDGVYKSTTFKNFIGKIKPTK